MTDKTCGDCSRFEAGPPGNGYCWEREFETDASAIECVMRKSEREKEERIKELEDALKELKQSWEREVKKNQEIYEKGIDEGFVEGLETAKIALAEIEMKR